MIKLMLISILKNGLIIKIIRNENKENNIGNNRNNNITADLGYWIVDNNKENPLINGAVNP